MGAFMKPRKALHYVMLYVGTIVVIADLMFYVFNQFHVKTSVSIREGNIFKKVCILEYTPFLE